MKAAEFERAVVEYRQQMFGFACSRLRDTTDAEEVVQQTVVELVEVYPQFTPNDDTHTLRWMMKSLAFRLIDRHRDRRRFGLPGGDLLEIWTVRPDEDHNAVELWADVDRVLGADWSADLRARSGGATITELATKRGMSERTYQRKLDYCYDQLREALTAKVVPELAGPPGVLRGCSGRAAPATYEETAHDADR